MLRGGQFTTFDIELHIAQYHIPAESMKAVQLDAYYTLEPFAISYAYHKER
jgi:hypothetical protein